MLHLLPLLLERVGLLIIYALLLSRIPYVREMIHGGLGRKQKIAMIAVFGAFGLLSNFMGIEVQRDLVTNTLWQSSVDDDGALANTRVLGTVLGGLLGGPIVGIGAGIIAGVHRYMLGGFTALACGVSTVLTGAAAGWYGSRLRQYGKSRIWRATLFSITMECVQLLIIIVMARPLDAAITLVKLIAFPMITMNGFGMFLFMLIFQSLLEEKELTRALQTHKALDIADQTLPYFRQGLSPYSCEKAAGIILRNTKADAVSITNQTEVLAHVGAAADHHIPLQNISTQLTKQVIAGGRIKEAHTKEQIQCSHGDCPLQAAIVLPLKVRYGTVGTMKLYYTNERHMDRVERELAEGLVNLFSTQLEIGEAELRNRLLKDAEIKALQAQIHPHFLFNAINTISALIRTDAEKARQTLLKLGVFFRSNLQGARQTLIPFAKELEHVEAYLSIERARFPDKYSVEFDIDPSLSDVPIPPFTLQPLVENAIRHGLVKGSGYVAVRASRTGTGKMLLVTEDNGRGVAPDKLQALGQQAVPSAEGTGTALYNISSRLREIYGEECVFRIDSSPGAGTKVTVELPLYSQKWSDRDA